MERSAHLAILSIALCIVVSNAFVCKGKTLCRRHHSASPPANDNVLHASAADKSIVEQCYNAWNDRNMIDAAACFDEKFTYDDGQYLGTISKRSELQRLFQRGANALPPNSVMVVDYIAKCPTTGNIGTQWHVERDGGDSVPYTRGCSFYTVDNTSGLIKTGFKVSEMIVKPSKQFSDSLVQSASKMMQVTDRLGFDTADTQSRGAVDEAESIIERYFQAWNRRDMKSALDCFTDDCIYETEDPVFVESFRGKDALREHLLKNAETLPSACEIILDDLAIDTDNGTSGVVWHLEANGVSIPNLRGCSMYTIDKESGLLKSGFDVTEAPVKVPGFAQDLLAVPLGKLLF